MSFRKRSEVIGNRTPAVPGRAPTGSGVPGRVPNAGIVPGQGPQTGSGHVVPGRAAPTISGRAPPTIAGRGPPSGGVASGAIPGRNIPPKEEPKELDNPGIRPSVITSQPTISTGTSDLDKLLGHQGIPLGNALLIEESGTTDFASVMLRAFASQGIMHNRIDKDSKQMNCHVTVVGLGSDWIKDLPGLYKGSSKEKKKAMIASNESKISVSNLTQSEQQPSAQERDLKIAWRYGLNKKVEDENLSEVNENYNYQFDLTERLKPLPNNNDISFIQLSNDYKRLLANIQTMITQQLKTNPSKTIRLTIPNLLIPSLYPPELSQSTFMIPFIHGLRALLKQYSNNLSLMLSLPIDLYPRSSHLTATLESLLDSVIHLQPFNQEMSQLIERAYKNEPTKIQHGLVNILKLPVLSERGLMTIHTNEYAFKNGRKKFEIEEWGIPVEDDSKEEKSGNPADNNAGKNAQTPEQHTTKNIDF